MPSDLQCAALQAALRKGAPLSRRPLPPNATDLIGPNDLSGLIQPDLNAPGGQMRFRLSNGVLTKVKNASREHRIGCAQQHAIGQMVEVAYPARCDDGHVDPVSYTHLTLPTKA